MNKISNSPLLIKDIDESLIMVEKITKNNIGEAEKQTIHVASITISALESALAAWENSKKPKNLTEKFKRYGEFRKDLADWLTEMLRSQNTEHDFETRQKRLAAYVWICKQYGRSD